MNQKIKNEKKKISLLPGDGIGKEISVEAKKILNWINENTDIDLEYEEYLVGGASIDENGLPLTNETLKKIKKSESPLG